MTAIEQSLAVDVFDENKHRELTPRFPFLANLLMEEEGRYLWDRKGMVGKLVRPFSGPHH